MSTIDFLIAVAEVLWEQGEPLPTDLYYRMASLGIDVPAAEANFLATL